MAVVSIGVAAKSVVHQVHLFSHLLADYEGGGDLPSTDLDMWCVRASEVPDHVPELGWEGEKIALVGAASPL